MQKKYWIPLLENNQWTGKALPLPLTNLQKFKKIVINNKEVWTCILNDKNYILATDKIFATPSSPFGTDNYDSFNINKLDKEFTKSLESSNGKKIILSGRLKGISKAKKVVITTGKIGLQSINNRLDYYNKPIYTKWGTIGLKVIC